MTSNIVILFCIINFATSSQTSGGAQGFGRNMDENNNKYSLSSDKNQVLEDLVQTSKAASLVYNITMKYLILNHEDIEQQCLQEIKKNRSLLLIDFYVVKITLKNSKTFLHNYFVRHYSVYSDVNVMHYAQELYENKTELETDQQIYLSAIGDVLEQTYHDVNNTNLCLSNSPCDCIPLDDLENYKTELSMFKMKCQSLWEFIIFGTYIDPICRILTAIIGLVLDITLLYIMYRENSAKTENNIMILNLAVNNVLTIVVYLPMSYMNNYHCYMLYENNGFISVQMLVISMNALTMLFLNVQRYFDVSRILESETSRCLLTPKTRCVIYTAFMWIWSASLGIFFGIIPVHIAFPLEVAWDIIIYLLVFSITLMFFNSMTARKLYKASQQDRTLRELQDITSASTILILTITFYIVHIVFYTYLVWQIAQYRRHDYFLRLSTRLTIFIIHMVFFSYPWLTIFIIIKTSKTFRKYFKTYLFCWCSAIEDGDYVTMSAVQNTEY